ncbi:MAG: chromosome partitioning protein [Limisphaerales bacterium]
MPRVIAIANQKGGVGKTTTAVNLSACLGALGKRVLLIDMDAQANCTSGLGLEKTPNESLYPVLLGESTLEEKIKETDYAGVSLIPSEFDLCAAEVELARMSFDVDNGETDENRERHLTWLKEALQPIVNGPRFDVVLIDCPPSLGKLTLSVLIAAHGLLIPLQCEYYSLEGISSITDLMEKLRTSGVNKNLELTGVLMTMFDSRTNLSRLVVSEVRKHFGDKVFRTVIPRATRVAESPSHGKPILYYDPYSAGSAAYEGTSKELAKRLGLE